MIRILLFLAIGVVGIICVIAIAFMAAYVLTLLGLIVNSLSVLF